MFFIVNKTKKTITLGDLGLSLGPRQAIDLDKTRIPRSKSDVSKSLMMAKKSGDVEVRVKDKTPDQVTPSVELPPLDNMGNIKEEIIGEMKDVMKEFLANQTGGVSKADLQELIAAMPKTAETVIYRQNQENMTQREDEEVEIDDDIQAEINARTVNNIVKDTKVGSVNYKEKHEEDTISSNVDELMDLL